MRELLGESGEDVTDRLLKNSSSGHTTGDRIKRVAKAKPTKNLDKSALDALSALKRKSDKSMGWISRPLAFSRQMPDAASEHIALIGLIKGGFVRVREIEGASAPGSIARQDSPYREDKYYELVVK